MIKRIDRKGASTRKRHPIMIQEKVSVSDRAGGFDTSWKDKKRTKASIIPMKSNQIFDLKTVGVDGTHFVGIRGKISISESDRILFGTRIFEILTIDNFQERNVEKLCVCNEKR